MLHNVVLSEGVRAIGYVPASPGQTHAAETSCFANMAPLYAAAVLHKLCFLLTSPFAHGESCSQGEMRHEVVFDEGWQVLVENNDQVRQTSLVVRSAFSAQTGFFTVVFCLC